jgi:hypothetical protein
VSRTFDLSSRPIEATAADDASTDTVKTDKANTDGRANGRAVTIVDEPVAVAEEKSAQPTLTAGEVTAGAATTKNVRAEPTAGVATHADVRELKEECAAQWRSMHAQLAELASQMASLAAAVHGERRGEAPAVSSVPRAAAPPDALMPASSSHSGTPAPTLGEQPPPQSHQQRAVRPLRAGPVAVTC